MSSSLRIKRPRGRTKIAVARRMHTRGCNACLRPSSRDCGSSNVSSLLPLPRAAQPHQLNTPSNNHAAEHEPPRKYNTVRKLNKASPLARQSTIRHGSYDSLGTGKLHQLLLLLLTPHADIRSCSFAPNWHHREAFSHCRLLVMPNQALTTASITTAGAAAPAAHIQGLGGRCYP